jgi:ribosomal protein L30E
MPLEVTDSYSAALEDQKNDHIRAVVQTGDVMTAVEEARKKAAADEAAAREKAHKELQVVTAALMDMKQNIGLINRLSYCRVVEYTTSSIKVDVILAVNVSVKPSFRLQPSADSEEGALEVVGTEADLSVPSDFPRDREVLLASAFFSSILCSNESLGPLSERMLVRLGRPSDIPIVLHQVCSSLMVLQSICYFFVFDLLVFGVSFLTF